MKACFDPYESVQVLRSRGELLQAEAAAAACGRSFCPAEIQEPCVGWLKDIRKEVPSLIVTLRDSSGIDVPLSSLAIDGNDQTARGAGVEIPLNPGKHTIELVASSGETLRRDIQLVAGEKKRLVTFQVSSPSSGGTSSSSGLAWTSPYVLTGTGVFLLGSAVATVGTVKRFELEDCKPVCDDRALANAHTWLTAADIGFVAAGIGLGGAVLFLFLDHPSATLSASVEPGRAIAQFSGIF